MIIHDTLSGKDEEFVPMHKGRINFFVCGPTVYDHSHIGHARTYVFFDAAVKFLRKMGYLVFYLQNITDIDDKIINRSKEEGKDPFSIADYHLKEYQDVMNALKVDSVTLYAKATLYIDEIISQIRRLEKLGFAYETDDGVYFEVGKFKDYGKLSRQDVEELWHGVRTEISENKKNPVDFALWKKMKPGEPYWESPWGKGRPGWHIEDTAITETYLGPEYDIHGGGNDLIFPHHEAEIAQMRAISGLKRLARYWMHTGMLTVNREKMSKSLKNFTTIRQILEFYTPEEVRFSLLNANYRTPLDFSEELMKNSRENLQYIYNLINKLRIIESDAGTYSFDEESMMREFSSIMENDFDTRTLIKRLLSMVSEINRNIDNISAEVSHSIVSFFQWVNSFMGIIREEREFNRMDEVVDAIVEIRSILRNNKQFELSDRIRKELQMKGVHIEDQNDKTIWWYANE